jgi:MYXO-CTERM domain-containing protein
MALTMALEGTNGTQVTALGSVARYAGALAGSDVFFYTRPQGTDSYVFFDQRPKTERIAYTVDVSHVAGLRLSHNKLEFLDASGTPQLQMQAPLVVSNSGKPAVATLAVAGCALNPSAVSKSGRAVTPVIAPGASTCEVQVSWRGATYPGGLLLSALTAGPGSSKPRVFGGATPQALLLGDSLTTWSPATVCEAADTTPGGACATPGASGTGVSDEQAALEDLGWNVTVVDGTTWDSMTAGEFAIYQLLVIGDPTCGSELGAAQSNASAWVPVVSGNILIIGTDPVYHYNYSGAPGAGVLMYDGLNYAGAQTGATGLYLDLSCAYTSGYTGTTDPILNAIKSGFTITSALCTDTPQVVATASELVGVTTNDLSDWSCSVHEFLATWPSDFVPVVIDDNATPSCGTWPISGGGTVTGCPYIVARGGISAGDVNLTGSPPSLNTGSTETLTATVQDGGTPVSGATVTFTCTTGPCTAGTTLTGTTDGTGTAVLTYSSTTAGTDTWTAGAVVSGTTFTSSLVTVVWTAVSPSFTASASPTSTPYGTTVTLSEAGIAGGATGTVTYAAGGSTLCVATLPATSCTTAILPGGTYSVTATYAGSLPGATATTSFTITQLSTSLVASASPTSTTYGNSVTLTGSGLPVTSGSVLGATGIVTFTSGGSTLCVGTVSAGLASCATLVGLVPGTYAVTAAYSGDTNYTASSATTSFTIGKAASTFTASAAPTSTTYGNTVTLSATGLPTGGGGIAGATGMVTFTAPGMPPCSISVPGGTSCTTTVLPAGTYTVTATYSGDGNYASSTDATAFVITQASTSFTASASPPTTTYGNTVALSELGLPGTATGTVTFAAGGSTLCTATLPATSCSTGVLVVGTYSVTATYSGDTNYKGATASAVFSIVKALAPFTASATPPTTTWGNTVMLSATGLPASATGTVGFVSGSTLLCSGSVVAGSASCTTAALAVGVYPVTAGYTGDSNYLPSTAPTAFTITTDPTTFTVTAVPSSTSFGNTVSLSATGLPPGATGTISFMSGATTLCGPITVSSGSASCTTGVLPGGTYTVTATYSGDVDYAGSTATTTFTISCLTTCPAGDTCGLVLDGCGGTVKCGVCAAPNVCGGGSPGTPNHCGCTPSVTTCPAGDNCGTVPDGCGGSVSCGACTGGKVCGGNVCGCTPVTSCPAGDNCGTVSNGCGGTVSCGTCSGSSTCGGGGTPNVCGCIPITACPAGDNCGTISDGCGGTVSCGTCTGGLVCGGNVCGCTPITTCPAGTNCGTISNGCGGTVTCGSASCSSPDTCGGAGTPNTCGCTPVLTCPAGDECGTVSNACGGIVDCGTCATGDTCSSSNKCVGAADAGADSGGKDSGTDSGGGKDSGTDSGGIDSGVDSGTKKDSGTEKDSGTKKDSGAEKDSGTEKDSGKGGKKDSGAEHHDSGQSADATSDGPDGGSPNAEGGGCSCRTAQRQDLPSHAFLWLGAVGLLGGRRLRRRSRPQSR